MPPSDPSAAPPAHRANYANADKLGAEITELCGYLYAATYRLLVLIRRFDEQGCWELAGLHSCAHWLNFQCGIGMNAAREKVRVARALAGLPKISAAFERGAVSYSKVRAMTRVATADNEDYLLMIAKHGTAWHMETLVSKYRRAARNIEAELAMTQQRQRDCDWYFDDDGSLVVRARLPMDQGQLLLKAIEHAMERRFRDAKPKPDAAAKKRPPPIGHRRADALAEVAETYLANDDAVSTTADRFQVVVHAAAETLKAADNDAHVSAETPLLDPGNLAHLENGPHVSAETARRTACDAGVVHLLENPRGEPLSVGRKTRTIPPAIRRALQARDGGCRFPGCTNTKFVDGHHIIHWANGGETSLENLVLLCRRHHRLVHEGGFRCERTADGRIEFHSPSKENLSRQRQATAIAEEIDLIRWFDRYMPDVDIDADTCASKWYAGDKMDWDLAVANMFH